MRRASSWRPPAALLASIMAACASDGGDGPVDPTLDSDAAPARAAELWVVPLDVWGRDLADATVSAGLAAGRRDDMTGALRLPLSEDPAALTVAVEAADHLPATVRIAWDGASVAAEGTFVAVAQQEAEPPVHLVLVGIDHRWFAASGRPPTLNRAELLRDGEDFWASVGQALTATRRRVTWATWWWESDFELVRPPDHATLAPRERAAQTALAHLERLPDVERRVLVNLFGDVSYTEYLNTDAALRAYAETPGDGFEVVLQANPTEVPLFTSYAPPPAPPVDFVARAMDNPRWSDATFLTPPLPRRVDLTAPIASWHQKAVVLDGSVAFVSGMNTKAADWDTHDHLVWEPRRMPLDATNPERAEVAAKEELPATGPRKDYGVRVEGPAARDVEEILALRWSHAADEGAPYAEHASPLSLDPSAGSPADGVPVQVVATLPEPWSERSLLEAHAKAIDNAERYVFVEDQYFRSALLTERLVARMTAVPDLQLIVVTKAMSPLDGGTQHTWIADQTLRALFPDRYLLLVLRSVDLYLDEGVVWDTVEVVAQDIDVHSKLRLVDDRFLSVGSCNFNNRGYLYEGELDVVVLDAATATEARRALLAELVGPDHAAELGDDMAANVALLRRVSAENQAALDWWLENGSDLDVAEATSERARRWPSGFAYPLAIAGDYLLDVGPDAF